LCPTPAGCEPSGCRDVALFSKVLGFSSRVAAQYISQHFTNHARKMLSPGLSISVQRKHPVFVFERVSCKILDRGRDRDGHLGPGSCAIRNRKTVIMRGASGSLPGGLVGRTALIFVKRPFFARAFYLLAFLSQGRVQVTRRGCECRGSDIIKQQLPSNKVKIETEGEQLKKGI